MTELAQPHSIAALPSQSEGNAQGVRSIMRFIDWIWHVKGSLPLAPEQSGAEALDRLEPLFQQVGTSHERTDAILTFRKKDPAAQDKMAVFESGVLHIERDAAGLMLRYRLASRTLLLCFLAPLAFLAFAQVTVLINKWEEPTTKAAAKKDEKKPVLLPQNPIDEFLGAPAPEKPKKDDKSKADEKKLKPTASYVFAGLFAALYLVGRILEAKLVKALFRKRLQGA
jgi:hypothetical protein